MTLTRLGSEANRSMHLVACQSNRCMTQFVPLSTVPYLYVCPSRSPATCSVEPHRTPMWKSSVSYLLNATDMAIKVFYYVRRSGDTRPCVLSSMIDWIETPYHYQWRHCKVVGLVWRLGHGLTSKQGVTWPVLPPHPTGQVVSLSWRIQFFILRNGPWYYLRDTH